MNPPVAKKRTLDLEIDDPLEDGAGNRMDIECQFSHSDKIDMTTMKYNMLCMVLQQVCGFRTRSFILNDEVNNNSKYIYVLLSLSNDNLLLMANRYKIKKEIDLGTFDFPLN